MDKTLSTRYVTQRIQKSKGLLRFNQVSSRLAFTVDSVLIMVGKKFCVGCWCDVC